MESKLNLSAIQDYSDKIANIFISEIDSSKQSFNGSDLLKLNEIKQVNLFIVKEIFFQWLEQMEASKSNYFDYENEDVKTASAEYMNKLSFHIEVKREDLHGLYTKAINDTILFYLVPDFFLIQLVKDSRDSMINLDFFKRLKAYIDLNRKMFESFVESLELEEGALNKEEVIQKLRTIPFEAEEKEIFDYLSKKQNLDVEQFLNIEEGETKEIVEEPKKVEATTKGFAFENDKILHEQYKKDENTVNDKHKDSKTPSLADSLQKQKISNIAKSISLNQKFIFIKELFDGNLDNYEKALSKLDSLSSWEEANTYIEEEIAPEFNWDISKDSVADFNGIVERRFR